MITAEMVKDLREKTGAGMMDCKKALTAANGDMEKAIENLRKAGVAKAEKKSGRATHEGKILYLDAPGKAVLVEVLCETDFAAKTDKFLELVKQVAETALKMDAEGDISAAVCEAEKTALTEKIATIGENMQIRRVLKWNTDGKTAAYLHMGGRVGVMIDAAGEDDPEFLKDICMHIAAFNPAYICPDCVPADVIAKEREIAAVQLKGKPANIMEKILDGKIAKFYTEACLVKQPWFRDDKTSLGKLKPNLKVNRFVRWEIGEEL